MIGRLTNQVIIEQPAEANHRGVVKESWSTLATVWAEVLQRGSRETYRQSQIVGDMTHLVRIRARSDVKSSMRLKWGTRYLNLIGPPVDVTIDGVPCLEMTCVETET